MRNRIVEHVRVKAKELVPHELNPRTHNDVQRKALKALWEKIGYARSVLAYRLGDGRLKLIDGHLRASMSPEEEVEVEVLDVNDEEARQLLLSIDPLAQLAGYDQETLEELREITEAPCEELDNLWQALGEAEEATNQTLGKSAKQKEQLVPEQFLIIVECHDEKDQISKLRKFKREGISCSAKTC